MRNNKGSTLIIVLLIAFTSLSIAIGMMQLSTTKTVKAVNNKYSLQAFYAAEAGLNEAIDTLIDNQEYISDEPSESTLELPTRDNKFTLGDAEYYVELTYGDDSIIIESTGMSGTSKKKIRTKIALEYDSAFNFGFLSKDTVSIYTGQIEYGMDIHGNNGIDGKGNDKNYVHHGSAIGTQSVDKNPSGATSYWGLYRPEVEVPEVDFDYFNEQMFGAIEPTAAQTVLTGITNISDTDTNIMFNSTYLNANNRIDIPAPNAISSNNSIDAPLIATSLNSIDLEKTKESIISSISHSTFINTSVSYSLSLGSKISDLVIGKNDHNNGNGNGNIDDPPEEDPVIEDPVDEPIDEDIIYEDDTTEDEAIIEDDTVVDDPIDDDIVYEEESSSPGNSGNSGNNDTNNGANTGGSGDITINIPAGDYNGKILYFDNADIGSIGINFDGIAENITIVATGDVIFCGADLAGEETGSGGGDNRGVKNFALATGGDITHNGRIYVSGGLYWLNGNFRQNGRSDFFNSRIIAQGTIDTHGHFSLTTDGSLTEYDFVPKKIAVQTWQEIAAE